MNAKARRAELSRMIDGTNYRYRYKRYVRTQLAIAKKQLRRKTIAKNPDIKKTERSI